MAAMARYLTVIGLFIAIVSSVADAQAAEWLAAHNSARAAVGVGPLTWSTAAYNTALAYARSKASQCQPLQHSDNTAYGENLAWSSYPTDSPTTVVRDQWVAKEKPYYDYATDSCSLGENMCGHYTQVVWAKTTSVGCAKVTCVDGGVFFICNYYPPGNNGQRPY